MYTYMCMYILYIYIYTCDLGFTYDTLDTFEIFEYICIYIYTYIYIFIFICMHIFFNFYICIYTAAHIWNVTPTTSAVRA